MRRTLFKVVMSQPEFWETEWLTNVNLHKTLRVCIFVKVSSNPSPKYENNIKRDLRRSAVVAVTTVKIHVVATMNFWLSEQCVA